MLPPGENAAGMLGFDPDFLRRSDPVTGNPYFIRGGVMYAILLEELSYG
jgi:hypothetical protein